MESSQKRIMIVEDNMIIQLDLEDMLEYAGYQVVAKASTGQEAIDMAIVNIPDLILMDIGLKGPIDGIETAERIKLESDVAIAFLSGNSDLKTSQRVLDIQAVSFIIKPINEGVFLAELEKIFSQI